MQSCSRPMPVEALASVASARMTKKRTKEKIGSRTPTEANQHSAGPYGPGRASQRRGAHLSSFHHGSRPKDSFISRDAASGHASFPDRAGDSGSRRRAWKPLWGGV